MKTAASMLLGVLVLLLRMDFAAATVITVNVSGHVRYAGVSDVLSDQIFTGQAISASYTYDTNTPDINPPDPFGWYQPNVPPAGVSVTIGQLTFQTVAPSSPTYPSQPAPVQINVAPTGPASQFTIRSVSNQVLKSGMPVTSVTVEQIYIAFTDRTGQWPTTMALPTGAPTPPSFEMSGIGLMGSLPGGGFNVDIQIDSVTLVPTTFGISPTAGDFLMPQHFDAAIVLPMGMQVASVQASVGGNPVPYLSYPGQCSLVPSPFNQSEIVCPNASQVLIEHFRPPMTTTPVTWQVTLTDGTVMTQDILWNLKP